MPEMNSRIKCIPGLLSFFLVMGHANIGQSAEIKNASWQWSNSHIALELNQRQPDQTRAFFQGRGFSPAQSDLIANGCVFQVTLRNHHPAEAVQIDLAQWRVRLAGGELSPLALETGWQEKWRALDAPKAARAAFRWALFPTTQYLSPGDWNMGMITAGLAPGTRFDLELVWDEASTIRRHRIPGLHCALDAAQTTINK